MADNFSPALALEFHMSSRMRDLQAESVFHAAGLFLLVQLWPDVSRRHFAYNALLTDTETQGGRQSTDTEWGPSHSRVWGHPAAVLTIRARSRQLQRI